MSFQRRRVRPIFALILACSLLGGCALTPGKVEGLIRDPAARPLVVRTASGPVQGVSAPQGEAFLGIPFAAPPVGPLRFHAPEPPLAWTTLRDAGKAGDMCPQVGIPGAGRASEDCLTLNVYAPAAASAAPRPVMVWLYGGGFEIGNNVQYDPSRLAQREGVIVVSPNYRLGALGFLAHPALREAGEGAFALQDQQAALRWVRDNIASFGGDPNNVTLFGESAGGWSVCYQLTSPGARGLFQKAIIESGACTSPDSAIDMKGAEAGGEAYAASLGCSDPAAAAACLRALPVDRLRKAKSERRGILGINAWSPAHGGDVLPLLPRTAFEQGAFAAVPVIDGTNHDEGRLFLYSNRLQGKLWNRASYERILGDFFGADTPKVIAEYEDEARTSFGFAYADLLTDSTFACPALTLNAMLRARTRVYAYEFNDPNAVNGLPRFPFIPPLKAFHSSEIAYVMGTKWAVADPKRFTPAQRALSDRMQDEWGAFARTGAPSTSGFPWSPEAAAGPLAFTPDSIAPRADFAAAHRCAFWSALGY